MNESRLLHCHFQVNDLQTVCGLPVSQVRRCLQLYFVPFVPDDRCPDCIEAIRETGERIRLEARS